MNKPHNSKKYAKENTGLIPDYPKKKTTRKNKKRTIVKETKTYGRKPNT